MGITTTPEKMILLLAIGLATLAFLFWPIRAPGKVKVVNADLPLSEPSTYLTGNLMPRVNGFFLRLNCYLTNTRFGLLFMVPPTYRDDILGLTKFGNQVCTFNPTFYPVRAPKPGSVEIAAETTAKSVPDTAHLRNSFVSEWRPKTIDDYISAYIGGVVTPVMIAEDVIAKIKFVNPEMNIFVDWSEEQVMQQAIESHKRYESGRPLSAFDGVPVVIKDQLEIKGLTLRCGIEVDGTVATQDAVVVERLRAQGSGILGLTNMHPLGVSVTGIDTSKYAGFCPNPFNLDYHPGASSSGTGVALAIGLAPVGIGTDGGGSVRIPATYCSLAGLKPSAGRIPHRGYKGGTNAAIGPMANTMVDCAKLYSIISGPDLTEASRLSWYQPKVTVPKRILKSLSGLKVGVEYDWIKITEADILGRFNECIAKLKHDGAEIVPITLPDPFNRDAAHPMCFIGEMVPSVNDHLNERTPALNEEVTCMLQAASEIKSWHYGLAQKLRTKFIYAFEEKFQQVDLIATPATAVRTFKISETDKQNGLLYIENSHLTSYFTRICNFTGLPAISTPMGLDSNEMPIGIQFISKWWDEEKLFDIGMYWERDMQRNKPAYYLDNKP